MATTNYKFTEKNAVLATLDPSSVAVSTVTTGWVSMAFFHSLCALIQTGAMGASGTIDAKMQQATDNAGTNTKDVTGKAIVQILAAAGSNKQASIELRGNDLDANNGFAFVRLSLTVGTTASIVGALLIGANPNYIPASANNQAAVVQQVG